MGRNRNIVTFLLLLGALFFPYWVYAPAIIIAIIIFEEYYEGIFLAVLIDSLYGTPFAGSFFGFPFGMGAALCIIAMIPIRERLRRYA